MKIQNNLKNIKIKNEGKIYLIKYFAFIFVK